MGALILGLLGMILVSLFIRLLGVEIGVWHKPICQRLVRVAAGRLPADEHAAAESEWLAVIEDMRSPTAQLLHSLSFTLSALRIRKAIEPQPQTTSLFKIVMSVHAGTMGLAAGATSAFLYFNKEATLSWLEQYVYIPTSKPVAAAIFATLVLLSIAMFWMNYLLSRWYLSRRARRRAHTRIPL